jgi:glycosyltransferase involved in cell wall biosynthesis
MRIVHVYKDYYPVLGGIENHLRLLAEAQAARGHDVTVLAASRSPRHETRDLNGVHVRLAGRLCTVASTPVSPGLFALVARTPADVVHLHFPHPPGEVAALVAGPRRPTVVTYHSDIVRQRFLGRLYRPVMRNVLAECSRILVTSVRYLESSPTLRACRARCTVVPLGVDITRFSPVPAAAAESARRRWGLDPRRPVLLFVGRLRYYKGLDHLLRAVALLPGVQLVIAGDGARRGACRRLAGVLGIDGRVVFTGDVSEGDLASCYRAASLFVLPSTSRAEAFGVTAVEAMACGLPVITTELGTGTSWVNRAGVTGLVVPPGNPGALAAAIGELLASAGRLEAYGAAARQRAERLFSAETMVEAIEQVYGEVASRSATSSPCRA